MANHCVNPCVDCGADLGEADSYSEHDCDACRLEWATEDAARELDAEDFADVPVAHTDAF